MDHYLQPNLLVLLGAWPLPNHRIKEVIKRSYAMIINIIFVIGIINFVHDIAYIISDTYLVSKCVTGMLTLIQNVFKNSSFMIRRKFLRDILVMIDELHKNTPLSDTNAKIMEIMKQYQNRAHWWIKIIISPFSLVLLIVLGYPWCLYLLKNNIEMFIITIYNHSDVSLGKFILVYIADAALAINTILMQIATAVLFTSCVLCICLFVDVLKYSIKIATQEAIRKQRVTPLFGKCIDYHIKILTLVKNIEKIFSPLLLTQFIISTTCICVVTFLLTQAEVDSGIRTIFLSYLVGINIEMFVYCYFGQLIQTKFEMLHMAGFHFPWYEAPLPYQKNMRIFLLCCSRPVILTAGKMAHISLEYHFALCKLSVSYYTLLRNVVNDK